MTLSWNIVAKNIHPHEQLQRKLRAKIAKLEAHLQRFPPDAVHLQVSLERNPKRNLFTTALTLRVPSHVLHSAKAAADPIPALDQAMKTLLRELAGLKAGLRREAERRRPRHPVPEPKPLRFTPAPLAPGKGPQTLADMVRQMAEEQYAPLVYHVRHHLEQASAEGRLPTAALDAEAVADEVLRQALSRPESKPGDQTYRVWFYTLARREIKRRIAEFQDQAVRNIPLEADLEVPNTAARGEGAQPDGVSILGQRLDWAEIEDHDFVPDGQALSPDAAASENDLIEYFQRATRDWPSQERGIFELHFLQGFETQEVATLEKLKLSQVEELIARVQARLRGVLTEAMQAKASAQPRSVRLTNRPKRGN